MGGVQQVAGEGHYQPALEAVAGGRGPEGTRLRYAVATLVREPDNPYDANAVRVDIRGHKVGYLPRNEASGYQALLQELESRAEQATCRARFKGGWLRGRDDQGSVGVELDISQPPAVWKPRETFLPADKSVVLAGQGRHQEHLLAIVGTVSERKMVAELRELSADMKDPKISAFILGAEVGYLNKLSTLYYQSMVRELEAAAIQATCWAHVYRTDKGVHVGLLLPDGACKRLAAMRTPTAEDEDDEEDEVEADPDLD
jgi:hypothetical protein